MSHSPGASPFGWLPEPDVLKALKISKATLKRHRLGRKNKKTGEEVPPELIYGVDWVKKGRKIFYSVDMIERW